MTKQNDVPVLDVSGFEVVLIGAQLPEGTALKARDGEKWLIKDCSFTFTPEQQPQRRPKPTP